MLDAEILEWEWLVKCKVLLLSLLLWTCPASAGSFSIVQVGNTNNNAIPFQGDPNAAVSAIGGTPVFSRTSCNTPCPIQISMSGITATGASVAYEQGEFSINFGDASGTETITDPWTGNTVNLNTQIAQEASYVYRSAAGSPYTVTVTARYCTSGNCVTNPSYITQTFTQAITVSAFSASGGTFNYSAGGSGSTCSAVAPCAITQFTTNLANNTLHLFNRGDTFSGTTGIDMSTNLNVSGVRLDAYGSGAKPKINVNSGSNLPLNVQAAHASETKSDIVIRNIEFDSSGSSTATNSVFCATSSTGTLQDFYLDNDVLANSVDVTGFVNFQCAHDGNATTPGSDTMQRIGLWMTPMSSPLTAVNTKDAFLGGPYNWMFIYGGTITGTGGATFNQLNHHFYHHTQTHIIDAYNTFGNSDQTGTSPTRNYNVKLAYDPGFDGALGFGYGQYYVVTHNSMGGTESPHDLDNATHDTSVSRIKNVVFAKNVLTGFPASADYFTAESATNRDEDWCNTAATNMMGLGPPSSPTNNVWYLKAKVYRERIYTTQSGAAIDFGNTVTLTTAQEITDNQVQSTSSTANLLNTVFSQQVTQGSTADRNDWYCPSTASGACLVDNGTGKTLAQWQASGFDAHGNQNNPNFPAPGSCNLGTRN